MLSAPPHHGDSCLNEPLTTQGHTVRPSAAALGLHPHSPLHPAHSVSSSDFPLVFHFMRSAVFEKCGSWKAQRTVSGALGLVILQPVLETNEQCLRSSGAGRRHERVVRHLWAMKLLLTSAGAGLFLLSGILAPILVRRLGYRASGRSRRRTGIPNGKSPERTEMQVVTTIVAVVTIVFAIIYAELEIFF